MDNFDPNDPKDWHFLAKFRGRNKYSYSEKERFFYLFGPIVLGLVAVFLAENCEPASELEIARAEHRNMMRKKALVQMEKSAEENEKLNQRIKKIEEQRKIIAPFLPNVVDSTIDVDDSAKHLCIDDNGFYRQFVFFSRVTEWPKDNAVNFLTEQKHAFSHYSLSGYGSELLEKREGEWSINQEGLIVAEFESKLSNSKETTYFQKAADGRFYLSEVKPTLEPPLGWTQLFTETEIQKVIPSGEHVMTRPDGSIETFSFHRDTNFAGLWGLYKGDYKWTLNVAAALTTLNGQIDPLTGLPQVEPAVKNESGYWYMHSGGLIEAGLKSPQARSFGATKSGLQGTLYFKVDPSGSKDLFIVGRKGPKGRVLFTRNQWRRIKKVR